MKSVLTENGAEFSADEIQEVSSVANIEVFTTTGNTSFQNGLCERIHAATESMLPLTKLVNRCSGASLNILLIWANMASNSLQMWHGYSSYKLVFGTNPNLPNIMTEKY